MYDAKILIPIGPWSGPQEGAHLIGGRTNTWSAGKRMKIQLYTIDLEPIGGLDTDALVRLNDFDYRAPSEITSRHFPGAMPRHGVLGITLVCLERPATSQEVDAVLAAMGLRDATVQELLALALTHQCLQRSTHIVSATPVRVSETSANRLVPLLKGNSMNRHITFTLPLDVWSSGYHFATVSVR